MAQMTWVLVGVGCFLYTPPVGSPMLCMYVVILLSWKGFSKRVGSYTAAYWKRVDSWYSNVEKVRSTLQYIYIYIYLSQYIHIYIYYMLHNLIAYQFSGPFWACSFAERKCFKGLLSWLILRMLQDHHLFGRIICILKTWPQNIKLQVFGWGFGVVIKLSH